MNNNKYVMIAMLLLFVLSGCATLLNPDKVNDVSVNSSGTQAVKVYINDKYIGTTPLKVNMLKYKKPLKMKFVKDGYETKEYELEPGVGVDTFYITVSMFTGFLTIPIDIMTGHIYELEFPEHEKMTVHLQKIK